MPQWLLGLLMAWNPVSYACTYITAMWMLWPPHCLSQIQFWEFLATERGQTDTIHYNNHLLSSHFPLLYNFSLLGEWQIIPCISASRSPTSWRPFTWTPSPEAIVFHKLPVLQITSSNKTTEVGWITKSDTCASPNRHTETGQTTWRSAETCTSSVKNMEVGQTTGGKERDGNGTEEGLEATGNPLRAGQDEHWGDWRDGCLLSCLDVLPNQTDAEGFPSAELSLHTIWTGQIHTGIIYSEFSTLGSPTKCSKPINI